MVQSSNGPVFQWSGVERWELFCSASLVCSASLAVNQGPPLGGVATDGTKIGGSVIHLFLELEVLVHIGC